MSDVCNYPLGDGKYCANDDVGDGRLYCVMHRRRDPLAQQIDDQRMGARASLDADHRALIEEVRDLHSESTDSAWGAWCRQCQAVYPCLTARLADALEEAREALRPFAHHALPGDSRTDTQERAIRVTVGQLATAWFEVGE